MSDQPAPGLPVPPGSSPMSERMQSLLSRAVEDQLSEQRQFAGILNEVHGQLSHISEQLRQVGGGGDTDATEQAIAGVAADLREAVRVLAQRLDAIGGMVQQRGADLAALTAAVDKVQQSADAHEAAIHDLRQAFTGVASRAAQLPTREDVAGIVDAATGRLADHVDAAVLALAEAVLRRRSGRTPRAAVTGATSPAAPAPTSPPAVATDEPAATELPTTEAPAIDLPATGPAPAAADRPAGDDEPPSRAGDDQRDAAVGPPEAAGSTGHSPADATDEELGGVEPLDDEPPDDDEDGGVSNSPVVQWQTPVAPPTPTTIVAPPDQPAKRKPWWRPSD